MESLVQFIGDSVQGTQGIWVKTYNSGWLEDTQFLIPQIWPSKDIKIPEVARAKSFPHQCLTQSSPVIICFWLRVSPATTEESLPDGRQDFQLALKQAFESFLNKAGDHVPGQQILCWDRED